jgi:hypothetical protein
MVEPPTLLLNNPLKTMKALLCKDLKLSSNKLLVLGSIKETIEPRMFKKGQIEPQLQLRGALA